MHQYKLREGESIRKPVVKRDRVEIHVPVLLLCFVLAAFIWLYIVGISKIKTDLPTEDTAPVTDARAAAEPASAALDVDFVLGGAKTSL